MTHPRRLILSSKPDLKQPYRRLYRLECGHTVSRKTSPGKGWAMCGYCPPLDHLE